MRQGITARAEQTASQSRLHDDLRIEGFEVEVVSDGEAGLRAAGRGIFDLILLDVMLPGKDGFTVCRELRSAGVHVPSRPRSTRASST